MIDWHSHVLPGIDDGSRNVSESLQMLELLKSQGVDTVIATPHFYADSDSVDSFLRKRESAYNNLKNSLNDNHPEILLGAEVCYYPGISKLPEIEKLRIQGTELLLLEMPVAKWTGYTVNEVVELAYSGEFTVIIAHLERYLNFQDESIIRKMREAGVLMQLNATIFKGFLNRSKAFRLLKNGTVQFIGSDCHNVTTRKSMMDDAFIHIRKKFGDGFVGQMDDFGYSMIKNF